MTNRDDKVAALAAWASDCVTPFEPADLVGRVRRLFPSGVPGNG
jgi:DNA-binding response OmpR family regulator